MLTVIRTIGRELNFYREPAAEEKEWKNQFIYLQMIFVLGGFFGFLYEELFYLAESGVLSKRGMTFGPWIPVYGVGAVLIALLAMRYRKQPFLVFAISVLASGILEYLTGAMLYNWAGIRLWDYNVEKWNWGNIGGYVCFRSVLFFGISGVMLIYLIYPVLRMIRERMGRKASRQIAVYLAGAFLLDYAVSGYLLWREPIRQFLTALIGGAFFA